MASGYVYLLLVLVSAITDPGFAIVARPSAVFHHFPQPDHVQVGPPQHTQYAQYAQPDAPRTPLDVPPPRRDEGTVRADGDNGGTRPQTPAAAGNGEYRQPDATRQTGPNANEGAPNLADHRPASGNELPRSPPAAAAAAVGAVNRNDGGETRWPNAAPADSRSPPAGQDKGVNEQRPGGENRNEASPDEINSSRVRDLRQGPAFSPYPPTFVPSYARPPIPSYGGQRFGGNRYPNRVQSYLRPSWSSNAAARPPYSNAGAVRPSYQPPRYIQPLNNGANRGTANTSPPARNPAPYVASVNRAPANYPVNPVNSYSSSASPSQQGLQYNAPNYPVNSPSTPTPYEPEPAYECPPVSGDFCYDRAAGHYAHSSSPRCFVQCDQYGESFVRACAGRTQWRGGYSDEPALGNMCS